MGWTLSCLVIPWCAAVLGIKTQIVSILATVHLTLFARTIAEVTVWACKQNKME